MVCQTDVDALIALLTEAAWLRAAGEPAEKIEWWVRLSLRQRLPLLPLTTGRELLSSSG